MRHNSAALDGCFCWGLKVDSNITGLWVTELTWYSQNATQWICLLEHGIGIHTFRPTWPCLIVKVLATWVKFLQLSDYYTMINCTFTFCITNVFGCFCGVMVQFKLIKQMRLCCRFICAAFKSQMEWSNAQCVSAPPTTILPTIADTFSSLNYFSHIIYMLQSSTYQNIAKLLTHLCIIFSILKTKIFLYFLSKWPGACWISALKMIYVDTDTSI